MHLLVNYVAIIGIHHCYRGKITMTELIINIFCLPLIYFAEPKEKSLFIRIKPKSID